ncbi:MAG: M23 family metallopeptidase [Bacteroidales bacterium]|jgi:murein DD-endopeptidase MepM/ murein hydrolase activator NlpD|nr:M23 family metallopeptidase [Bacteroidales bacterium]
MSEQNYRFDSDSLSFEKEDPKKGRKFLISFSTTLVAALVIGAVVFLAITNTIKTPGQREIEMENNVMREEYERLDTKYKQSQEVLNALKEQDRNIYRSIYETDPFDDDDNGKDLSNLNDEALLKMIKNDTDTLNKLLMSEETQFTELKYILENSKEDLTEIPCVQPITDDGIKIMYYGFGQKLDPIYKTPQLHKGLDIAATIGTEVIATASGTVDFVGENHEYGKYIVINHKNDYQTVYAHLSEFTIKRYQKVKRGDIIGFVGNTGKSLAPHLHYEIIYKNRQINPVHYFFGSLRPEDYGKLKKIVNGNGLSLD